MFFPPRKMNPEIMKVLSLSSTLCAEDQIKFLDLLISTKSPTLKKELINRVLIGERVWEKRQAG